MSIVSGIQCDWCGRIASAQEDALGSKGWRRITVTPLAAFEEYTTDLCPACAEASERALAKAKKRRRTGKAQR